MTAPTPEQITKAINDVKRIRGTVGADSSEDYYLAENILIQAATSLAAVTAERDQARQKLADAPHGLSCESRPWFAGTCNCWKAGL